MRSAPYEVLDAAQLRRIESTHRGFLYQHLFAAGCLLQAPSSGALFVAAERDEDVEIRLSDRHVYCQVKTRKGSLQPHDVSETLERFESFRAAHASTRAGLGSE